MEQYNLDNIPEIGAVGEVDLNSLPDLTPPPADVSSPEAGTLLSTGKAALRVGGSLVGGLTTGLGAMITHPGYMIGDTLAAHQMKPEAGWGSAFSQGALDASNRSVGTMEFPAQQLIKTPEEMKSMESVGTVLGAPGAGLAGITEGIITGDVNDASKVITGESQGSSVAVPFMRAVGDTAGMYALSGEAIKAGQLRAANIGDRLAGRTPAPVTAPPVVAPQQKVAPQQMSLLMEDGSRLAPPVEPVIKQPEVISNVVNETQAKQIPLGLEKRQALSITPKESMTVPVTQADGTTVMVEKKVTKVPENPDVYIIDNGVGDTYLDAAGNKKVYTVRDAATHAELHEPFSAKTTAINWAKKNVKPKEIKAVNLDDVPEIVEAEPIVPEPVVTDATSVQNLNKGDASITVPVPEEVKSVDTVPKVDPVADRLTEVNQLLDDLAEREPTDKLVERELRLREEQKTLQAEYNKAHPYVPGPKVELPQGTDDISVLKRSGWSDKEIASLKTPEDIAAAAKRQRELVADAEKRMQQKKVVDESIQVVKEEFKEKVTKRKAADVDNRKRTVYEDDTTVPTIEEQNAMQSMLDEVAKINDKEDITDADVARVKELQEKIDEFNGTEHDDLILADLNKTTPTKPLTGAEKKAKLERLSQLHDAVIKQKVAKAATAKPPKNRRVRKQKLTPEEEDLQVAADMEKVGALNEVKEELDKALDQEYWEKKLEAEGLGAEEGFVNKDVDIYDLDTIESGEGKFMKDEGDFRGELNFGFMGTQYADALINHAIRLVKDSPTVENITRVAKGVYNKGVKNFGEFRIKMKEVLGDVYDKVSHLIRQAYEGVKKWNEELGERGSIRLHPAPFPKGIQEIIANELIKRKIPEVLDIFGGIGKIGGIKKYGYKGIVKANELEPKWGGQSTQELQKKNGVDVTTIGDSRKLNLISNSVPAIATSPTYGNSMAVMSKSKTDSYRAFAGGTLKEGNTGGEVWGPAYEQLHKEIYKEAYRVVEPNGYFILNMKDKPVTAANAKNNWIPKKGSTVVVKDGAMKATNWHIKALGEVGFRVVDRIRVDEAPAISKRHELSRKFTVGYEDVVVLQKAPRGGTTLDMFGMQTMYEIAARKLANMKANRERAASERATVATMPGAQLINEVRGTDNVTRSVWSLLEGKEKDIKPWSRYLIDPQALHRPSGKSWVGGTQLGEELSFMTQKSMSLANENIGQHMTGLGDMFRGLNKAEREQLGRVREKHEVPMNEKVAAASEKMAAWLDGMLTKEKQHQRVMWDKHLPKNEAGALRDLINGRPYEETIEFWNKDKSKGKQLNEAVIRETWDEYTKIDSWGLEDYIPHTERGSIRLVDGEGTVRAFAVSKADAIRKAYDLINDPANPIHNIFIDNNPKLYTDTATAISRSGYYAIMRNLAKSLTDMSTDISKGVAQKIAMDATRKEFSVGLKNKFSEYVLDRKNILKGEPDVTKLLPRYAMVMEKRWALDPVIYEINRNMSKLNNTPEIKASILQLMEDAKGRYWFGDKVLDTLLASSAELLNKSGTEIAPKPFAYSRLTGRLRGYEGTAKLGYRVMGATVNKLGGSLHTITKTGVKIYAEAGKFIKTPEGKAFLDMVGGELGMSFAQDAEIGLRSATEAWKPMAMWDRVELANRTKSVAANYLYGKKVLKLSDAAATDYAIKGNWMQQFCYDVTSLPEGWRGPTMRTVLQFKPYILKEMEFLSTLSGREWARYIMMQGSLMGPKGLLLNIKSLPFLAAWGKLDDVEEYMNKEAPHLWRGALGWIGDPSSMASISIMPQNIYTSGGSGIGLSDMAIWMGGVGVSDIVKTMLPFFKGQKLAPITGYEPLDQATAEHTALKIPAMFAHQVLDTNVAYKQMEKAFDMVMDKNGNVYNENHSVMMNIFDGMPADMEASEKAEMQTWRRVSNAVPAALGLRSTELAAASDFEGIQTRRDARMRDDEKQISVKMSGFLRMGEEIPPTILKAAFEDMGMSIDGFKKSHFYRQLTPVQQAFFQKSLDAKARAMEGAPMDFNYGLQQSPAVSVLERIRERRRQ